MKARKSPAEHYAEQLAARHAHFSYRIVAGDYYPGADHVSRVATVQLHSQHALEYGAEDFRVLRAWYFEREAGYPNLKKFEGEANWPDETGPERLMNWACGGGSV